MHKLLFTFIIASLFCFSKSHAQQSENNSLPKYKIAVFAPLYLDSVYKEGNYQYPKKFPRFVLPGLAFVQGMEIASDSFPISDCIIETMVFDTKSDTLPISEIINRRWLNECKLIIVSGKDREINDLAGFAKNKGIPLISATYPNDAGIRKNPGYILMNATLKTHCERIFGYLLQKHSTDNIILVRQSGSQEDRVLNYINAINTEDNAPLLPIKTITLDSNFYKLKNYLDSNENNIIVCGSLDEAFAEKICKTLAPLQDKYYIKLMGMPNTPTYNFLDKNKSAALKSLAVYYTTPYFISKENLFTESLKNAYLNRYKGFPSESAYKGFELMYVFSRLIALFPGSMLNHLNDDLFSVFNEYKFMPVLIDEPGREIDYIENKHLYLIKRQNGKDIIAE